MEAVESDLESIDSTYATKAELELKIGKDENDQIVSMLNASADIINITSNRLTISSDNFSLSADGTVRATAGKIANWNINSDSLSGSFDIGGDIGSDGIEWYLTMENKLARPVDTSTHILSVTATIQKGLDDSATYSSMETAYISADGEFRSQALAYDDYGEPYIPTDPRSVSIKNGEFFINGTWTGSDDVRTIDLMTIPAHGISDDIVFVLSIVIEQSYDSDGYPDGYQVRNFAITERAA